MSAAAVLRLRGVVKDYPSTPPVRALAGVNLTVTAGELVAVVGASGSGKSTLLGLMGALDRPTRGTVEVAGTDLDAVRDRDLSALRARHIGFVFQQFHLLPGVSALGNVEMGLLYRGGRPRSRRRSAAEALERVGLTHRAGHCPAQLSGGEQQRVAIARAVVSNPAVLLADEPTGNLDSVTGRQVLDLLGRLHRSGTTIVLITHDPRVAAVASRVVRMHDGRLGPGHDPVLPAAAAPLGLPAQATSGGSGGGPCGGGGV
jgi:putative ABC transport system ATP-binding protein